MDLSEYISSIVRWILDMLSCRSAERRWDLMDDKCHMDFLLRAITEGLRLSYNNHTREEEKFPKLIFKMLSFLFQLRITQ